MSLKFKLKFFFFFLTFILLNITFAERSYASILFQDDFNDLSDTPLSLHNNLWQGYPGLAFAVIENNEVRSSNNSNSDYDIPSLIKLINYCSQVDFTYPLPQTNPYPDFFSVSTRGDNVYYTHHYSASLNAQGLIILGVGSHILYSNSLNLPNGRHTFKLCSIDSTQNIYIDNNLIASVFDSTYQSGAPGFDLGNNTPIDNFIVTSVDSDMNVPLLKQTSDPWQSLEYDSGHLWNPSDPSISAWGCALTSAAMVFQYYGIYTIPGSGYIPLDPGTLNDWLKSQPDGYVGDGWVNWLALSRLSKLAVPINGITTFDALEYQKTFGHDTQQLSDDLNNSHPDILEEPGHFIVAKGINTTTFDINDPYYDRHTLNDGYSNTFLSLGRYSPSSTDLSYIMFVTDQNTNITVTNSQGESVGASFVQSSISDPKDLQKNNTPIKIFYFRKPDSGKYTVSVTGPKQFHLASYLYDTNGNPEIQNANGFPNTIFSLSYDKTNNASSSITKTVTFQSTIQDIKEAQNLKLINKALALSLISLTQNAQKQAGKQTKVALQLLEGSIKLLTVSKNYPILISKEAYSLLIDDFKQLKTSLEK